MPRKSKTAMEEGFLRSLWAEIAEMEEDYNRVVVVTMNATAQKGVFYVSMSASALTPDSTGAVGQDKISLRYPNSSSSTFAGFLWSMGRRLCDQVAEVDDAIARGNKTAG